MKILHVTQNYEPSKGGTQHTMKKVSEYCTRECNDEVTVYTTNSYYGPHRKEFKKIDIAEETMNGVFVKRFDFMRAHKPFAKYLSLFRKKVLKRKDPPYLMGLKNGPISPSMFNAMKQTDADVICASSIHYLFSDYPLWKQAKRKPFVLYGALHLDNHGIIPKQYLDRIRFTDCYIANTEFEKECIAGYGINRDKIKVVGAATDVFEYADKLASVDDIKTKYNIAPHAKVMLCLGRQDIFKSIHCLLDAYKQLKQQHSSVCLIVAGAKGNYTDELLRYSNDDASLHVLSNFTDVEKCELLKTADILVLPSSAESFGVVFLEAWSYHKPVIGAGVGAVASVIENAVDGLLFKPGDATDLALQINTLLNNEALCKRMGAAGYNKVMQQYTWPVIATRFRDCYQMAIESQQTALGNGRH